MSEFINADCMDYLPKYPDGYFDLAITDPPYGGGLTQTQQPSDTNTDGSGRGSTATSPMIRGGQVR